jgi:Ni,Fe-hydrogenase I large subunit
VAAEGKLHIETVWDGSAVSAVSIRSSRPQGAGRMLQSRMLQDAVAAVPRLFGICRRAQGVAAAMAAEAALGTAVADTARAARKRIVLGEIIHESLWRMLLDWPAQAGLAPRVQAMAAMRSAFGGLADEVAWSSMLHVLRELLRREVLGCDPEQWLELESPQALEAWCSDAGTVVARAMHGFVRCGNFAAGGVGLMPRPGEAWLREVAEAMRGEGFAQQPAWRGEPLETGALARQWRHPLLQALPDTEGHSVFARLAARLIELARLAAGDGGEEWFGSLPLGEGAGLAWVETVRGLLLHRIASDGERVLQYRIVAPTEWNFHAGGALVRGLAGMRAASVEEARRRTEWLVQSLDPCVACEITLMHP